MSYPASEMASGPTNGIYSTTNNTSSMDALDRGVNSVLSASGHQQSRNTTEKISDGVRKIFKKATGKDIPIEDKN